NLSYKAGDKFLTSSQGKSNQNAIFLDTTGRSYSLQAHTLPSARGQGEPLTGRLTPPSGATFISTLMGKDEDQYLLCTDAGYGFIGTIADMQSKNKAGKNLITVPDNARVLNPAAIVDPEKSWIAAVSNEGRMLVFPAADLPQMARGKGNKMISINSAKAAAREELMVGAVAFGQEDTLLVYAGKRHLKMKFADLEHYLGERGRRGNKLPRGFQNVDAMEVVGKD
ncbi:DNA gyrase C-terminal beta-propeller domain-containing protein, partial [Thalassolituus sp. UBA6592]